MKRFFALLTVSSAWLCTGAQVHFSKSASLETGYPSFVFELEDGQMRDELLRAPMEGAAGKGPAQVITLPLPGGQPVELSVWEAPIMAEELARKYPEIKTYKVTGNGITGRIGYTYKGFHGILFTPGGSVYIDPIGNQAGVYHAYYRKDFKEFYAWTKGHTCLLEDDPSQAVNIPQAFRGGKRSGEQLRTYSLALACTGEYAQFHGGTVPGALSAMVVSMNRVNGVYEREFAITMQLIANNDELIFLNASTDPYTNNNGGAMLNQNQSTINSIIGTANYDIGHVFSTGGGGIASLGSVCSSTNKARGVTGSGSPVGDPFDIDYVAHEMGHQFGGEHTFNSVSGSCSGNREGSSAYEPGSGSTIMAYAGICGADDLQSNSDDYFHAHSLDQVIFFSQVGAGNTCATITNTGNVAPVVDAGNGGFTIPKQTPFVLTGSATDANDATLTYCWEQMDLGPGGDPDSPSGNAPIFRTWDPTTKPWRTFPRLVNVIIGNTVIGETYPTYSRDMNFRLTVRDENINGGGMGYDEISFEVDGNSGPFEVTSPDAGSQVEAQNPYAITWDVAGTNLSPVNCQQVVIELCVYSGGEMQLLETLAAGTPNDGSEDVVIPSTAIGAGRYIRVRAADNVFFNLNGGSFSVIALSPMADAGIPLTATPDYVNELVQLNWLDSFSNEHKFMIERSLGDNQNFVLIDSVPANTTTYDDLGASMYGQNYYRIYAKNTVSESAYSNEATYQGLNIATPGRELVKLFPNPASDELYLHAPGSLAGQAVIMNATGSMVATIMLQKGVQRIDISHLAPGLYWMRFSSGMEEGSMASFQVVR